MYNDLATVNIHNKGLIPWLNMIGPKYNISISWALYNRLKEDPAIVIYLVNEDPVMAKMMVDRETAKNPVKKEEPLKVVEEVKIEEKIEIVKEAAVKIGQQIPLEGGHVEPYQEIPALDEQKALFDPTIASNLDKEIEEKLLEVDESEEDDVVQPTEEDLVEIQEHLTFKRYSSDELMLFTKARLKNILNVERGFKPGDAYYGGYHDNHPELVEFVLKSQ
jgi:hypothetical protein